jgi:hypothetical protein
MEGSLVAYKVFTNGSTLQASELNENLMQQSTAVFSNAAARTAAITSPVEGQLTYLEDVNRYETYNGSSWVTAFGLTLINSTSFTSATVVSLANIFTSAFDNYKAFLTITSATASQSPIRAQLSAGGTNNTASNYRFGAVYTGAAASVVLSGINNSTEVSFPIVHTEGSVGAFSEINISKPFLTANTSLTAFSAGSFIWSMGGNLTVTNSYDGLTLFPASGNMTGSVRVYGVRN